MSNHIVEPRCTGCTACKSACPVQCITMKADAEGFLVPVVEETRCIDCGKCKQVCPLHQVQGDIPPARQAAYAAVTSSPQLWRESSSGGAFTELCHAFGDENTVIFGAMLEGKTVFHKQVTGVGNIGSFRKSKYVASDLRDTFLETKCLLTAGKQVIWSGTPCQIAGLKSYLDEEYPNLLCIDLICHGVGSPLVFSHALQILNREYRKELSQYTFRAKNPRFGNFHEYTSYYQFKDGTTDYVPFDRYNQLFLSQLCLRNSCGEHCKFRSHCRYGDLTIADFRKKELLSATLAKDYRNYSTIVVNSAKGEQALTQIGTRMRLYPCSMELLQQGNPLFFHTTPGNPKRDTFFADCLSNGYEETIVAYTTKPQRHWTDRLKDCVPYRIRAARSILLGKIRSRT